MRLIILLATPALCTWVLGAPASAQAQATRPAATQPAASTQPAAARAPQIADPNLRRQIDSVRRSLNNLRAGPKVKLADLVQMRIEDSQLRITISDLPDVDQQQTRLDVTDTDGIFVAQAFAQGANRIITLTRYDFDAAARGGLWHVVLQAQPGQISMNGRVGMGSVNFWQAQRQPPQINLFNVGGAQHRNFAASSIIELARQDPDLARDVLKPMLAAYGGVGLLRPGATEIYRVFSEISADPDLVARLQNQLIPQLDSPDFAERNAADQALGKLGRDGVLAVLRTNQDELTDEQRNRLHLFVVSHIKFKTDDPAAARKDADFLIDCLSDDDPRVRQAALAALSALAGKPLDFDLNLKQDEAARAAERLRTLLPKPKPQ